MAHLIIKSREAVSKKMKPSRGLTVSKPDEGCLSDSYVKDLSLKFISAIHRDRLLGKLHSSLDGRKQKLQYAERTMHT